MRIASLKSRTARSRSPLRLARLPLSMSAVTLALTGLMGGGGDSGAGAVRGAVSEAALAALPQVSSAAFGSGAPCGGALSAPLSPADLGRPVDVVAHP